MPAFPQTPHPRYPPLVPKNNIDLRQFVFASTALLSHSDALLREAALHVFASFFTTPPAIPGLIVVSGYLSFMSLENSRSVCAFLEKRVRRINRGYFVVVVEKLFLRKTSHYVGAQQR